jgi:ribosomal protein S18 acetylase RimI-like enzyme
MINSTNRTTDRSRSAEFAPIEPLPSDDIIIKNLADAFAEDTIVGWLTDGPESRVRFFTSMLGGLQLSDGCIQTAAGGEAVAVWVPSERLKGFPALREWMAIPGLIRAAGVGGISRLARFGLALALNHRWDRPHDYLMFLGVRAEARRCGFASVLLQARTDQLDRAGRGAFLETANPANLAFYERHGFVVWKTARPPGGGPTIWSMWRDPLD